MAQKAKKVQKTASTPVVVLAQWLSYVFWALTIVAVAYVTSTIIGFYTDVNTTMPAEFVAYGVVALLVLLPLALVADVFHGRHEDDHKSTASSVVMVIHAVLFALVSIGALITTAFFSISPLFSTTPSPTAVVDITTSAVVFVLFASLLVRVSRPRLFKWLRPVFRIKFGLVGLVALGFAIAGPLGYGLTTKNDRLTRDALVYVSNTMNAYVAQGNDLPANIEVDLGMGDAIYPYGFGQDSLRDEAIRLQKAGVITYTPNIQAAETSKDEFSDGNKKVYFYELCGTYEHTLRKDLSYGFPMPADANGFSDYLSIDSVEPGKQCYKLKATRYLSE